MVLPQGFWLPGQETDDIPYYTGSEWRGRRRPTVASVLTHTGSRGGLAWAPSPTLTNLIFTGWGRGGSAVTPANTGAGELTVEKLWAPDQSSSALTGLINAYSNGAVPVVIRTDTGIGAPNGALKLQGAADSHGSGVTISGIRSRGSIASPTAVTTNNNLLFLGGGGFYNTSDYEESHGYLRFLSTENWSSTARGTQATLGLTPNGSTVQTDYYTWTSTLFTAAGVVNAVTGYQVNAAAATGNVLRGDGTNFVSSALATGDLTNALTGTWSPTVTQSGTVTSFSTTVANYQVVGNFVIATVLLIVNNAGGATGANDITVSLPITSTAVNAQPLGSGFIFDSSSGLMYKALVLHNTGTTVVFRPTETTVNANLGTSSFTAALATGDYIAFTIMYTR